MKALWTIVTPLIMTVGLLGTVLPFIPGILLIYVAYLLYGFATGWQAYGLRAMVGWSVVTTLSAESGLAITPPSRRDAIKLTRRVSGFDA